MRNVVNRLLRDTGIASVGSVPWGTHICQFYQTREDLLESLIPYFKAGLEGNESCLCVVANPLTAEDTRSGMRQAMPDFDERLDAGQMEILDGHQFYSTGERFNVERALHKLRAKLNDALARGYQGLRLTGNCSCLNKQDWAAFAQYEAIINSLISHIKVIALCQYWLSEPQHFDVLDVIHNHPLTLLPRKGIYQAFNPNAASGA